MHPTGWSVLHDHEEKGMTHSNEKWPWYVALGLYGIVMFAQQPEVAPSYPMQPAASVATPTEVFRGRLADLRNHPFHMGELTLTLDAPRWGAINLQAENTADHFLEFHPKDLSIVNSKRLQIELQINYQKIPGSGQDSLQVPLSRLAPKTFVQKSYFFAGVYKEQFKIFFGEKLLAEIAD